MNYWMYGGDAYNVYACPPANFKKPTLFSIDIILSTKTEDASTDDDFSIYTNGATIYFEAYFTHTMLVNLWATTNHNCIIYIYVFNILNIWYLLFSMMFCEEKGGCCTRYSYP